MIIRSWVAVLANSIANDSFFAVCTDGTCGTSASSFFGTLNILARSGDANTVTLMAQAGTGNSLSAESASASADPFIFVDPTFAGASLYTIAVSPGVGNSTAAPEPASVVLVNCGLLLFTLARGLKRRLGVAPRPGIS